MRGSRLIHLLLLCVVVLMVAFFVLRNTHYLNSSTELLTSIPGFSASDYFGEEVNKSSLLGKKSFVQFIDPSIDVQRKTFMRISPALDNEDYNIILFIKPTEEYIFNDFVEEIHQLLGRIYIINENYLEHKRTFKVPVCCENFNIFDEKGILIASDPTQVLYYLSFEDYLREIKSKKANLTEVAKINLSQMIKRGEKIADIDLLSSIESQILETNSKYYVIALFNQICIGCPSGQLIKRLDKIQRNSKSSLMPYVYLLDNFTEIDLGNLKSHLDLNLPIKIADSKMSNVWRFLIDKHGENQMNNIFCLINENGEVLDVMEPSKPRNFFSRLIKLSAR